MVFNSLIKSVPFILKQALFALSFLIISGLYPLKYLKGKLNICFIDEELKKFVITKEDCLDYGGNWLNYDFHFDNIGSTIFNLVAIAIGEGMANIYMTNYICLKYLNRLERYYVLCSRRCWA